MNRALAAAFLLSLLLFGCGDKEPSSPAPGARPAETKPAPATLDPEKFKKQASEEWAKVCEAVDTSPKNYRKNISRLRDYLMVYDQYEQAGEARKKIEEIKAAWKDDASKTLEKIKSEIGAAVAAGDFTSLNRFDEIPDDLRTPDVAKKILEEKKLHEQKVLASFAEAEKKAAALGEKGKMEEVGKLLAPYEKIPVGNVATRARDLAAAIKEKLAAGSQDTYEIVGKGVFSMASERKYALAEKAIEEHLRVHPSKELPRMIRRDLAMVKALKTVWEGYEQAIASLSPGDTVTLQDIFGDPPRTGAVVSVKDRVLTMRTGKGLDEKTYAFNMDILPSTEVVRLTREKALKDPTGDALVGMAAMLCIDYLTPPGDGYAQAVEYVEAARKTGQPVEYYREILDKKNKEPLEIKAEFMFKAARILAAAGEWKRCRAKCVALRVKYAATVFVLDYANDIDRMMKEGIAVAAPAPIAEIPLTAHNLTPTARENEPVSAGVPFPRGTLTDDGLKKLAVLDDGGNAVPAQFSVTSRWWRERDRAENPVEVPSVQWLLVDMLPSVPANGRARYTLKTNAKPWKDDGMLKVTKEEGHVTVVTGPLKFTVKRDGFNLFDEVWADETGKGDFGEKNRIVAPHKGGLVVFSSFGGSKSMECSTPAWLGKNKYYSSVACKDTKLTVEEQGPVKVTIRASGRHVSADALQGPEYLLDFEIWIKAFRGSPYVSVEYVFLCRQGKHMEDGFPIDGIYIDLPTVMKGSLAYTLGRPDGTADGALAEGQKAYAVADASDHYRCGGQAQGEGRTKSGLPKKFRWFYDQKNGVPLPGKKYPEFPSPDNLGWIDLSDGGRGVTAGISKFWQTWPKAVEARGDGRLRIHLWANPEEEIRTMPEKHLACISREEQTYLPGYDQKWESLISDTVPGRGNLFPGLSKSNHVGFRFHGKPNRAEMKRAWAAASRPVRVLCDPSWYCENTRVYGFLASSDPDNYDPEIYTDILAMDATVKNTIDWMKTFRAKFYDPKNERMDQYGAFNFGDSINCVANRGEPMRIRTLWDNNYYDSSHAMFCQFFRTGDIDILEQAVETDAHLSDVDMTCWHMNPEMIGASRYSPSADHVRHDWGARTVWTPRVYSWHRVNFDRWYLFGNRWAYEQNYRGADFVVRNSHKVNRYQMGIGHGDRSTGHAIKNAAMGYLATGEKKFLEGAKRMWAPNRGRGSTADGYQAGILIEGAWWYWQAAGDPAALSHVVGRAPRTEWSGTKFFSYGFAFRVKNDPIYMKVAYEKLPTLGKCKGSWGAMQDFGMAVRNGVYFPWFVSALPVETRIPQVPVD